jgi:acetyl-CoA acetyltransferase
VKGHPFGVTGLAQCAEPAWQLRGQAVKFDYPERFMVPLLVTPLRRRLHQSLQG